MATFTVTTASDAVDPAGLSLREALVAADGNSGADTIYFAPVLNETTLVLTQGELTIKSDVTIDGGELQVTIDADGRSRVLAIQGDGTDVTLDSLHITGGHSTSSGGGILAGGGTSLTVVDTEVVRNSANGQGGGIFADSVTLDASTVHHNTVNNAVNAVSHGGGIYAHSVTLTNSTVAFNRVDSAELEAAIGGGIYAAAVSLTDSTLTGNYATYGGGAVYVFADDPGSTLTISNSIVVGNAMIAGRSDISGAVTESNGHNLFGSDVDGSIAGDLENVTAQSVFAGVTQVAGSNVVGGALAANGGPTETAALLDAATNPALGRGEAIASLDTDQRGEPRPATNPDVGAFELEQSHQTVRGTQDGELLTGGRHGEALLGLAGGDRLRGGHGEDLLDGGRGADRLQGGPDGDVLIGGASADRFVFSRPHDSRPADPDLILDFSQRQGDRIDLHKLDGDPDAAGNQRLEFIGGQRFSDAGQVRALEVDGHTVIQVNLDHGCTAELRIELHDELELHRADFVL